MKLSSPHTCLWLPALTLGLALTACSKDELAIDATPGETGQTVGDFYIKLTLNPGTPARTARTDYGDPERPGVNADGVQENAINSVYLFFENYTDATQQALGTGQKVWFRHNLNYAGSDPVTVTIPVTELKLGEKLTYGQKNVYVGINLTEAQAEHFAKGNAAYTLAPALQYGLTEPLAPGRGIGMGAPTSAEYTRHNIAMFGLTGQRLELVDGKEYYLCDSAFVLKRTVAKVLATCRLNANADGEAGVKYANLSGSMLYPEKYFVEELQGKGRGWIRQQDVGYLVNALNKQTYLMQRRQWNINAQKYEFIDPNYTELEQYLSIVDGLAGPANYSTDFYYTTVQQRNEVSQYYVRTLPYDESRMQDSNPNHYYEGLYCPENTFTTQAITLDGTDHPALSEENRRWLLSYNLPWPMVTHVSITNLFTPREMFVESAMANDSWWEGIAGVDEAMKQRVQEIIREYDAKYADDVYIPNSGHLLMRINADNEAMAQFILTASLRKENFLQESAPYDPEANGYPPNTYLFIADTEDNNVYRFFTLGAAKIVAQGMGWDSSEGLKNLPAFTPMPRGRGYYYTYIDNRQDADPAKDPATLTFAEGQVERNVYYILTIDSFSNPGHSGGGTQEFVKVHTRVTDWKLGGQGSVTLD